jgi:hypothetical protein
MQENSGILKSQKNISFDKVLSNFVQMRKHLVQKLLNGEIKLQDLYNDKNCFSYLNTKQKCTNCKLLLNVFESKELYENREAKFEYKGEELKLTYHRVNPSIHYYNTINFLYQYFSPFIVKSTLQVIIPKYIMFNDGFTQQILLNYFLESIFEPLSLNLQNPLYYSYYCGLRGYRLFKNVKYLKYADIIHKYGLQTTVHCILEQVINIYQLLYPYHFYYGCLHVLNLLYLDEPYNSTNPFTVLLNNNYYNDTSAITYGKIRMCNKNALIAYQQELLIPEYKYIDEELYYKITYYEKCCWRELAQLGVINSIPYELWQFIQTWIHLEENASTILEKLIDIPLDSPWISQDIFKHFKF